MRIEVAGVVNIKRTGSEAVRDFGSAFANAPHLWPKNQLHEFADGSWGLRVVGTTEQPPSPNTIQGITIYREYDAENNQILGYGGCFRGEGIGEHGLQSNFLRVRGGISCNPDIDNTDTSGMFLTLEMSSRVISVPLEYDVWVRFAPKDINLD